MLRTLPTLCLAMTPTLALLMTLEFWARQQVGTVSVRDGLEFKDIPDTSAFCFEPDPELGHRPRPSVCGFNEYGFVATGAGQRNTTPRRVMVLGDNTRGLLLGSGDLGLELAANPEMGRLEIWEGLVPAYDVCDMVGQMAQNGWELQPEVLLVYYGATQHPNLTLMLSGGPDHVTLEMHGRSVQIPRPISSSALVLWAANRWLGTVAEPDKTLGKRDAVCLGQLNEAAITHHTRLGVVLFPQRNLGDDHLGWKTHGLSEAQAQVLHFAEQAHVPVLNLQDVTLLASNDADHPPDESIYFTGVDRAMILRYIATWLKVDKLLPLR